MTFTLKGLIYGQPGIGKSTIALSAPKPFFIDTENGLKRVNPEYSAMAGKAVVETYDDILDILNSDKLDKYDTIIIDTAGRLVDKINNWLYKTNQKQKKGDGSPSMQGWGAIKVAFSNFIKLVESKNKSVIFVAHEKEDKIDERLFKRPDIAGSSGKELVKDLDFIGYMSKIGNKATIDFNPSESYYAKNSIGTDDFLEFSKIKGLNNFLAKEVFEKAKNQKLNDSELGAKFALLIAEIEGDINDIKTIEQANKYYKEVYNKHQKIWSSDIVERNLLAERMEDLDFEFDKKDGEFKSKVVVEVVSE
jgi:hypothetical protein